MQFGRLLPVLFCLATSALAQPVEIDPSDFGKILIAPRQSAGGLVYEQAFGDYQNEPVIDYGIGDRDDIILRAENEIVIQWSAPEGRIANLTIRQDKQDEHRDDQGFAIWFKGGSALLEESQLLSV